MVKLLLTNYISEWKKNLFCISVIFCVIASLLVYVENIYSSQVYNNFSCSMNDYFYYSCNDNTETTNLTNSITHNTKKIINNTALLELLNNKSIDDIGYSYNHFGNVEKESVIVVYLGGCLKNISYKLSSGKWSDIHNKNNVIISGNLTKKYTHGDSLTIKNIRGETKKYNICGTLKRNSVMLLNTAFSNSNDVTYQNIISNNSDSYILTTDYNVIDFFSMNNDISAYIINVSSKKYNKNPDIFKKLNGTVSSFKDIKSNSNLVQNITLKNNTPILIMFFCYCILTIICEIILCIYKESEKIKCIQICGASKKQISILLISNTVFNFLIAFFIYYIFFIKYISINMTNGFDVIAINIELIIFILVTIFSYLFAQYMINKEESMLI